MPKKKDEVLTDGGDFDRIVGIIEKAKERAYSAVNKELIEMYWQIGKYVSEMVLNGTWGKGIVNELSKHILRHNPNISGFSPQNLWRMRQFYDTYKNNAILSTVLRELSWSINVRIMSAKTEEAREFYLRLADLTRERRD